MEGNQNLAHDSHNLSGESAVEDIKLLIDCIKYQTDDLGYQEQALKTIAHFTPSPDKSPPPPTFLPKHISNKKN